MKTHKKSVVDSFVVRLKAKEIPFMFSKGQENVKPFLLVLGWLPVSKGSKVV